MAWINQYSENKVNINEKIPDDWKLILDIENMNEIIESINKELQKEINDKKIIYPIPNFLFTAMKLTPLNNIKVIILGQDPYHGSEIINKKIYPQAMGLSFSVGRKLKVPSSLKNIYKNLQKYKIIDDIPKHGDLTKWAKQGCLMLNTSLTVLKGEPNSHKNIWKEFTDRIIEYISKVYENKVFILWGKNAAEKNELISKNKGHKIIISSHPSGLSCNNTMKLDNGLYSAFMDVNIFGETNRFLSEHGSEPINWNNL